MQNIGCACGKSDDKVYCVVLCGVCVQEDPAKALSDAERLKRQRMEEEESERSQRLLLEQVGKLRGAGWEPSRSQGAASTHPGLKGRNGAAVWWPDILLSLPFLWRAGVDTWTCPPQHQWHCSPGESRRHKVG